MAVAPHESNKLKLGEKTPCLQLKKITIMWHLTTHILA